jgi:hypothetical protein
MPFLGLTSWATLEGEIASGCASEFEPFSTCRLLVAFHHIFRRVSQKVEGHRDRRPQKWARELSSFLFFTLIVYKHKRIDYPMDRRGGLSLSRSSAISRL